MDMEHEIPKKLGVLATHGDGEPPKILDARYVESIKHYFDNPEKRDYHLTLKGKLLWDQIHMFHWYARELCLRYDLLVALG